jgi:hypothetical protein
MGKQTSKSKSKWKSNLFEQKKTCHSNIRVCEFRLEFLSYIKKKKKNKQTIV